MNALCLIAHVSLTSVDYAFVYFEIICYSRSYLVRLVLLGLPTIVTCDYLMRIIVKENVRHFRV